MNNQKLRLVGVNNPQIPFLVSWDQARSLLGQAVTPGYGLGIGKLILLFMLGTVMACSVYFLIRNRSTGAQAASIYSHPVSEPGTKGCCIGWNPKREGGIILPRWICRAESLKGVQKWPPLLTLGVSAFYEDKTFCRSTIVLLLNRNYHGRG